MTIKSRLAKLEAKRTNVQATPPITEAQKRLLRQRLTYILNNPTEAEATYGAYPVRRVAELIEIAKQRRDAANEL